jgi:N utilization substance protein B
VELAAGGENADSSAYARELVQQVLDHTAEVDALIRRFAPAWPLDQIAIVDRNILRIALCELLFREDVPAKVVVNEAVEVAKSYGGDGSSRFVNGVLGSFLGQVAKTA